MPTVFVFGAGASNGENLQSTDVRLMPRPGPASPPLSTGFFTEALYKSIGYDVEHVQKDYADVFGYIRARFAIDDELGKGRWMDLNIEDVFSSIEVHREFVTPEGDAHARLTLTRNCLTRYIQRIIGLCTSSSRGGYYREIKEFVCERDDASVITFNWDLLLDREFVDEGHHFVGPYARFEQILQRSNLIGVGRRVTTGPLFLKPHGSLNWFKCTNPTCPYSPGILISHYPDDCLRMAEGIHFVGEGSCGRCGSAMIPFIVAPILKKPVTENSVLRTVWGLALQKLEEATTVVIVGFSAAPSDFYAKWLLRSAAEIRGEKGVNILVVDPANDGAHERHDEFQSRMAAIFPHGYNDDYRTFSQVRDILSNI
jgi:hypothetical protein